MPVLRPADVHATCHVPGHTVVRPGPGGAPSLRVVDDFGSLEVACFGAHCLDWTPHGQAPVLYTSPHAVDDGSTAIRGGIPVCWPRFADNPAGSEGQPFHGQARITTWHPRRPIRHADGSSELVFTLPDLDFTDPWHGRAAVSLRVRTGRSLRVSLTMTNRGADAFTCTEALHTYLRVGDVRRIWLTGLGGASFVDKSRGGERRAFPEIPLRFAGYTDATCLATPATVTCHDPVLRRDLLVAKAGSMSTVVWNPWTAKAAEMPDLPDAAWPDFCCIETANALDDAITLAPGATHTMTAILTAHPWGG